MKELIEKYGTSGTVAVGGQEFPIINIPMMSDEKWQELARENAVHNFIRQNGREPVSVDEAVEWQRAFIAEREKENSNEWYCDLFKEPCDQITQLDVDEFNDFSQCNGDCENCWSCIKD